MTDPITTEYSTTTASKSEKSDNVAYSDSFESGGGDSYESDFTDASSVVVTKKKTSSSSVQTDPVHVVESAAMDPGRNLRQDRRGGGSLWKRHFIYMLFFLMCFCTLS